jgi:hypothetical protein
MSTIPGKRLSTFSGNNHSTEIRVKEGRLNLYQGLEAIHTTLFRVSYPEKR